MYVNVCMNKQTEDNGALGRSSPKTRTLLIDNDDLLTFDLALAHVLANYVINYNSFRKFMDKLHGDNDGE